MAALPPVVDLSKDTVKKLVEATEKSTNDIKNSLDSAQSVFDKVSRTVSDPTLGLGDILSFSFISETMSNLFSLLKKSLEPSMADNLNDAVDNGHVRGDSLLEGVNDRLDDIHSVLVDTEKANEFANEKKQFLKKPEGEAAAPEINVSAAETGGFVDKFLAMIPFGGFISGVTKAIAPVLADAALYAGVGGAMALAMAEAVKSFSPAEAVGDTIGANDNVAGITQIFTGMEGDLMSTIGVMGRWATAGAAIGLAGGPVGWLAGALIGAALGGLVSWLTNWIGFDNIVETLSNWMDTSLDVIDIFTGTNVERLQGRLDDFQKAHDANTAKIEALDKGILDTQQKLDAARLAGNQEDIDILEKRLEGYTKQREDLTQKNEVLDKHLTETQDKIDNAHGNIIEETGKIFNSLFKNSIDNFNNAVDAVGNGIKFTIKQATGIYDSVTGWISDRFGEISKIFSDVADTVMNFDVGGTLTSIKDTVMSKIGTLTTVISDVSNTIMNLDFGKIVQDTADLVMNKLKDIAGTVIADVTAEIEKFTTGDVVDKAMAVLNLATYVPGKLIELLGNVKDVIVKAVMDKFEEIKNDALGFVDPIVQWFKGVFETIKNTVLGPVGFVIDRYNDAIYIGEKFGEAVGGTLDKIQGVLGSGAKPINITDNVDSSMSTTEAATILATQPPPPMTLPPDFYKNIQSNQQSNAAIITNNLNNTTVNMNPIPSTFDPDYTNMLLDGGVRPIMP